MEQSVIEHVRKLEEVGMDHYQASRVGSFVEDARKGLVTVENLNSQTEILKAEISKVVSKEINKLIYGLGGSAFLIWVINHIFPGK